MDEKTERQTFGDIVIPADEAYGMVQRKEAFLLDVVGETSWEHLSAVPAASLRVPPEELRARLDEFPFERAIVAYCT